MVIHVVAMIAKMGGCVNLKIPVQFVNGGTCSGNDLYGGWLWHNGSCDSCY